MSVELVCAEGFGRVLRGPTFGNLTANRFKLGSDFFNLINGRFKLVVMTRVVGPLSSRLSKRSFCKVIVIVFNNVSAYQPLLARYKSNDVRRPVSVAVALVMSALGEVKFT